MTDDDVIETFIDRFADRFRFDPRDRAWFCFVDGRWKRDDTSLVFDEARLLARELRGRDGPKRMATYAFVRMIVNQARHDVRMQRPRLSFRKYIKSCGAPDTPTGDFVRDARQDTSLPDAVTWPQLATYLGEHRACGGACHAARDCWRAYQQRAGALS